MHVSQMFIDAYFFSLLILQPRQPSNNIQYHTKPQSWRKEKEQTNKEEIILIHESNPSCENDVKSTKGKIIVICWCSVTRTNTEEDRQKLLKWTQAPCYRPLQYWWTRKFALGFKTINDIFLGQIKDESFCPISIVMQKQKDC